MRTALVTRLGLLPLAIGSNALLLVMVPTHVEKFSVWLKALDSLWPIVCSPTYGERKLLTRLGRPESMALQFFRRLR